MSLRPLLLAAALAGASVTTLASAPAQAGGYIGIQVGGPPPPPRYERIVVRPGSVWVRGHWQWRHGRYVWIPGHAVRARPGYAWMQPAWRPYGRQWQFRAGYWARIR